MTGRPALDIWTEEAEAWLEADFLTPEGHESVGITVDLIGPTILVHGTDEQRSRYPLRLRCLAQAAIDRRVRSPTLKRAAAAARAGGVPGPEGSIGTLATTEAMRTSNGTVAERALGLPREPRPSEPTP